MKIIEIMYQRVNNLGNFETERLEAKATISEDESPAEALSTLKRWVEVKLGIRKKPTKKMLKKAMNLIKEADEWTADLDDDDDDIIEVGLEQDIDTEDMI